MMGKTFLRIFNLYSLGLFAANIKLKNESIC